MLKNRIAIYRGWETNHLKSFFAFIAIIFLSISQIIFDVIRTAHILLHKLFGFYTATKIYVQKSHFKNTCSTIVFILHCETSINAPLMLVSPLFFSLCCLIKCSISWCYCFLLSNQTNKNNSAFVHQIQRIGSNYVWSIFSHNSNQFIFFESTIQQHFPLC